MEKHGPYERMIDYLKRGGVIIRYPIPKEFQQIEHTHITRPKGRAMDISSNTGCFGSRGGRI